MIVLFIFLFIFILSRYFLVLIGLENGIFFVILFILSKLVLFKILVVNFILVIFFLSFLLGGMDFLGLEFLFVFLILLR